jgi:hypothetical protein
MEALATALLGVGPNVAIAIVAALISAIGSLVIEVIFYGNKTIGVLLTAVSACIAAISSFVFLTSPTSHSPSAIFVVFLTSVALWAVCFHVLAFNFGAVIGDINLGRWSVLAKRWVKAIDYVYLSLSTLAVLRIVMSAVTSGNDVVVFNALAAVLLGFAVALRVTKTSIEIFDWDKPPTIGSRRELIDSRRRFREAISRQPPHSLGPANGGVGQHRLTWWYVRA